jgi:predicted nuclease of predicted toxin-antitoxin system
MPLSPALALWLRAEGRDAVHANELSMHRTPDSEILQVATHDDRVVTTADLSRDFWPRWVRLDRG